jgi:hypothetical protein
MTTGSPGIIIRMPDIRRALMCGRGTQGWFRLRNLDYDKFITDGYPIEELEAIDCDMARQVCAAARLYYTTGDQ